MLLAQERHQRQQAEILRKIGTTLSAVLDFDELLDLLIDQLALIMPGDSVEIFFIVDAVSHMMRQRRRPSLDIIRYDIADPDATTFAVAATRNHRHIISSGEALIIPDIQQYEGWQYTADIPNHFHGWAGVPLFANNKVQSILAVYSERIDAYHEQDVKRLFAFARQAELAMQNAMLYQSTKQRLNELTALQEEYRYHKATYASDIGSLNLEANGFKKKDCNGKKTEAFRSKECYYALSLSQRGEDGFILRARAVGPQTADEECQLFSLDDLGNKEATSDNCWY